MLYRSDYSLLRPHAHKGFVLQIFILCSRLTSRFGLFIVNETLCFGEKLYEGTHDCKVRVSF